MNDFRELGISESTLKALDAKGISTPTPIQAQTIPLLLEGDCDVVGRALTGTGKTAAFGIPIIERIRPGKRPKALVLTPTRELCMQNANEILSLCGENPLKILPIYGGQAVEIQLRKLERGCDVAVGTPGRVIDMLERGALKTEELEFVVLDEADEMLDMGFVEDIEKILARIPEKRRMLLFSATMPKPILEIAETFMRGYRLVSVADEATNSSLTEQFCCQVRREDKIDALVRLIEMEPEMYAMIFCRTRADVDELVEKLHFRRCRIEALHGEISQAQRTRVIEGFKQRRFKLLAATDVAARGIDVNDLTHVINFSLPGSAEIYIHRIGRTGRAGKSGVAITFATPGETFKLRRIQQEIGIQFEPFKLPGSEEVAAAHREKFINRLVENVQSGIHEKYFDFATDLLFKNDPAEIVAAILQDAYKSEFLAENYPEIGGKRNYSQKRERPFSKPGNREGNREGNRKSYRKGNREDNRKDNRERRPRKGKR